MNFTHLTTKITRFNSNLHSLPFTFPFSTETNTTKAKTENYKQIAIKKENFSYMMGTLVEISGQNRSTKLLRLESAWSFSEGWLSFNIASKPPAELTIVAAILSTVIQSENPRGFNSVLSNLNKNRSFKLGVPSEKRNRNSKP